MTKWRTFLAVVVIFNVVLSVGFVLASNYLFDYLNTEIGDVGYTDQGLYVIPYIRFSGFQVNISHDIYENGQVVNLGTLSTVIPNYPYILFWASTLGNIILITTTLFLYKTKTSRTQQT
ncbi:MAG: hypothetical protein P8017_04615 [Deltaproteobacteria bacterium]|jgi:hypothetical protein